MAIKVTTEVFKTFTNMRKDKKQTKIDMGVNLDGVKRILSVAVYPIVEKKQKDAKDNTKIEGVCNCKIHYINEDGKTLVHMFNEPYDFTLTDFKVNDNNIICINAVDTSFKLDENIQIAVVLEADITQFEVEETTVADCGEEVCKLEEMSKLSSLSSIKTTAVVENHSFDLGKGNYNILDFHSNIVLKSSLIMMDKIGYIYKIQSIILYEGEDGKLFTKEIESEQKHEIALGDGEVGNSVFSSLEVLHNQSKIELLDNNEGEIILPFNVTSAIFQDKEFKNIVDAYCISHDLKLNFQACDLFQLSNEINNNEKLEANFKVEKENISLEKVLYINNPNVLTTKVVADEGSVLVEGIVACDVICENFNESADAKELASITVEMPFSIKTNIDGVKPMDFVDVSPQITHIDARVKRTTELDVLSFIDFRCVVFSKETKSVLSNVEVGELKPVNGYGMSFYNVESGQDIWAVAKKLSIDKNTIIEQNPNIELPSEKNEKIVIYRQRVINNY